ncbi:MAG: D-tyrosyl-tRNA(Tyr) deacylase [Spirochaetales bacterium]|nr:D-tyrosyl-tRNA(Tyr) deacylase [Spirochaetales bacterium]
MRAVVQRIKNGSVYVDNKSTGTVSSGLLVYLGIADSDQQEDLHYLVDKIVNLRIFADNRGKMNLSLLDVDGELLVVSQFTLYGDARKGRRPSYSSAADPSKAETMYNQFIQECKKLKIAVSSGVFGAMMDVSYTNCGPVTILLDSKKLF